MFDEKKHVAVFIDWDNLMISIAADMGGAAPDIRRIIQRVQEFGTILVARAYAEWQVTSDRLNVYRAGVEPVYAPTFRFEVEPPNERTRGKSLADPAIVADFVDLLHVMPDISVFVIVSGDKDMLPLVRLAQLRGKHVVVIGPDYVANVLREMADEFIAYRSLLEETGTPPQDTRVRRPGGRSLRASAGAGELAAGEPIPDRPSLTPRPQPQPQRAAEAAAPAVAERPRSAEARVEQRPRPQPQAPQRSAEDMPVVESPEGVFDAIQEVLRQRGQEGEARVRATHLREIISHRVAGFSERKYGFHKFTDLLQAADRAGVVVLEHIGPVHWASLPRRAEAAPAEEAAPVEVAAPAPAPVATPA